MYIGWIFNHKCGANFLLSLPAKYQLMFGEAYIIIRPPVTVVREDL